LEVEKFNTWPNVVWYPSQGDWVSKNKSSMNTEYDASFGQILLYTGSGNNKEYLSETFYRRDEAESDYIDSYAGCILDPGNYGDVSFE